MNKRLKPFISLPVEIYFPIYITNNKKCKLIFQIYYLFMRYPIIISTSSASRKVAKETCFVLSDV